MAKEVVAQIKLQIPAGQANPAPPVGTALGPRGVNIMAFCKEFNAATQKQAGDILPVVITVYKDKSFTFITKSPPAAVLLKKAANIAAGSKEPNKTKVGKVTRKQVMDIVNTKRKDLNARDDEAAFRTRRAGCWPAVLELQASWELPSELRQIASVVEIFPALQRDWHVAVFPDEIMEGAQIEFFALSHARVGEKFQDLQLANLICDGAARAGGKSDCFLARGQLVHWNFLL